MGDLGDLLDRLPGSGGGFGMDDADDLGADLLDRVTDFLATRSHMQWRASDADLERIFGPSR